MEVSEVTTEEIFEITDSSINVEKTPIESSKRRYSPDLEDDEESKELSSKKFKDEDSTIAHKHDENDMIASINTSDEMSQVLSQTEAEEPSVETSNLDKSNEIESDGDEKTNENDDDVLEDNGHAIDSDGSDIEEEIEDEESENTSDEDDDDLMTRAVNASKSITVIGNDEPIALDSDSEMSEVEDIVEEEEESRGLSYERNNPFPYSYRTRMLRYSPRYYIARKLLKRSINIVNLKLSKKNIMENAEVSKEIQPDKEPIQEVIETAIVESKTCTEAKTVDELEENLTKTGEQMLPKKDIVSTHQAVEPMEEDKIITNDSQRESYGASEEKSITNVRQKTNDEVRVEDKIQQNCSSNAEDSSNACNQESEEVSLFLTEISKNSVEDLMNKFIFNCSDNNQQHVVPAAMEDFTEKLFMCLQQNKHDIQKVQQIWNEKLHIKYKIREIMERIRRHRAVVDIESFGYKPIHDNPIVSSKSSTTNSENDHFEKSSRMSSESVSRLIQDVRASVLKREQKQRIENHISMNVNESTFDESNPFAHLQNLQANQGRQGQIIDVQSIINDFRQKNPQEIPRRGRRFKSSFGGHNSLESQSTFNQMEISSLTNESFKNNSPGFPEVSLLPVNSFYRSLPQTSVNSPFGQKSSLLQSILTKSTKSPVGLQHINNTSATSSTLARLLTAPERERTMQNTTPRQMGLGGSNRQSNGEITITPIQPGSSRKQDYSMDDEENSTDGHLVIDESDFDVSSDRKSEMLLCQGCRRHKALFMCAGCSKQWYCSKECQELAWDDHAESCMV